MLDVDDVIDIELLTNDVDGGRWRHLSAGVGRFEAVDAWVFVLVKSTYLERARLAAVVAERYDILRIIVNTHSVLEPRHSRVRYTRQVTLE